MLKLMCDIKIKNIVFVRKSLQIDITSTPNNMFTLWVFEERSGGKSDHITSPGVTTAKTESQGCPVQRRREHRAVR